MVFKSRYPEVEPDAKYEGLVTNFYWSQLDKFKRNVLFVDYESQRHWTGAQIKLSSARLARNLIKHGLKPGDNCLFLYKNCDYVNVVSLGIFFAGGSRCTIRESDTEQEHAHILTIVEPKFMFVGHKLVDEMLRLRSAGEHNYTIVIMDDDEDSLDEAVFKKLTQKQTTTSIDNQANKGKRDQQQVGEVVVVLGLHHDLLPVVTDIASANTPLPVQVDPQQFVFIDFSSGSTGRPKPIGKTHRNCLYLCLTILGDKDLWDWDESSSVAISFGLIFHLNQCLTHGYKSIIMSDYKFEMLLDAIKKHRLTHLMLGSPLVHNLVNSREMDEALAKPLSESGLGSLRNVIATGSPIATQSVISRFMKRLPGCSVVQTYGLNEASFLTLVPRELPLRQPDLDERIVGYAMPNVEFKLVSREEGKENEEITEFDQIGELYVRSPTMSAGYHGDQFREQNNECFLADGFYKTFDICSIGSDGMLRVHGRYSQVLALGPGDKVLPSELERVIMQHPLVKEAAVIGLPNPKMPGCQAARAYVVPRDGVEIDDAEDASLDELFVVHRSSSNGVNDKQENAANNNNDGQMISRRIIFEFVAKRVNKHKYLNGGIEFLTELPRLASGKIDKMSLKAADGFGQQ